MTLPEMEQKLIQIQDAEADLALLRDAIGHESVTGNEAAFASFLMNQLSDLDMSTGMEAFLPGRPNTWGVREGLGDGPHLMFVGHTDTVHVRGWSEHWKGQPQENPWAAYQSDDEIWGRGACDLKGGICAAIAALRLLDRSDVKLSGTISFAFVGDEESGEPGTGVSAGAKDLVARIKAGQVKKPDFAVYVEPTTLDVYTAQIGFLIAEITVTGRSAYFGTPEDGVDALKATGEILASLWQLDAAFASGTKHDLVGSSGLLVTEVVGGGYIAVPGECKISLIRKLRPEEDLDHAVTELETVLAETTLDEEISISINYPAGRDHPCGGSPVEIDPDHPSALLLADCIGSTHSGGGAIGGAPYWSETPFLVNTLGCPAVYCAPGDISFAHTFEERISVEEYLAAVRAFALFIARYCGTCN
ncbi:M20 family metallopeptidase [Roseobacter sp. EG26]|uniref:M20 family metallopeptidase n=1 Tax=Roseobacter sp. EG26 TaxID=3412477 RepID=UPI003CE50ABD